MKYETQLFITIVIRKEDGELIELQTKHNEHPTNSYINEFRYLIL